MLMTAYEHDLSEFPLDEQAEQGKHEHQHEHHHHHHHDQQGDAQKAEADFEGRLRKFYGKYHPDKLSEAHKIAKHYWKHEEVCTTPSVSRLPLRARPSCVSGRAFSSARSLCTGMGGD